MTRFKAILIVSLVLAVLVSCGGEMQSMPNTVGTTETTDNPSVGATVTPIVSDIPAPSATPSPFVRDRVVAERDKAAALAQAVASCAGIPLPDVIDASARADWIRQVKATDPACFAEAAKDLR